MHVREYEREGGSTGVRERSWEGGREYGRETEGSTGGSTGERGGECGKEYGSKRGREYGREYGREGGSTGGSGTMRRLPPPDTLLPRPAQSKTTADYFQFAKA